LFDPQTVIVPKDDELTLDVDFRDSPNHRVQFQLRQVQQALDWPRRLAESIDQLGAKVGQLVVTTDAREAAVQVDFQPHVVHIVGRQEGIAGQTDINLQAHFGRTLLQRANGVLQKLAIEFISHGGNVTALLCAEHVARATDFQIAHCNGKARPQLVEFLDRPQPASRIGREVLVRLNEQVAIGPVFVASDTAAKLV
jgi:hypothetical protein